MSARSAHPEHAAASARPPAGPLLVTGATGFLGRHVLQALAEMQPQQRVLALVRKRKDWAKQDWSAPLTRVEPLQGSVSGEGGVAGSEAWPADPRLQGLTGIFHLAALVRHSRRDPTDLYATNVEGTLRMVRLAAQYRCRMVFVSTSGTVGVFALSLIHI